MTSDYLKQISVSPDDLLLDPNNPRLVEDLRASDKCADSEILSRQKALKSRFAQKSGKQSEDEEEFTDISDLYESMIRIGYVAIDRIVVRHIESLDKYVVVEGNRRVSTIKLIRDRAGEDLLSDRGENSEKQQYEAVRESFELLEVLELKTKGLSEEEVDKRIDVILGLRHFGSVLDWKPLNRAFNAYKNYMAIEPPLKTFVNDNKRIKDVASRLSISKAEVTKALETFIVFEQLSDLTTYLREDHYSLIEAALPLKGFNKYFVRNDSNFRFDDASLQKLAELSQFELRVKDPKSNAIIFSDPKKFGVLRKILKEADTNPSAVIRDRATALAEAVRRGEVEEDGENAGNLVMSVDKANSLLRAEIVRLGWVKTLQKMLDKQAEELPFDKYDAEGDDLMKKMELEQSIRNLRVIFGL